VTPRVEFTGTGLSLVLAESRFAAEAILDLAHDLEVKLPGTRAAWRDGTLRLGKARIIADAARLLDPAGARAAEVLVLGRGRAADAGRAAVRDRPRGDAGRAGQGGSAGSRRRRTRGWSGGPKTAAPRRWSAGSCRRPRCSPPISASPGGPASCARPAWTARWMNCGPGPTRICCSAWTLGPAPLPRPPIRPGPAPADDEDGDSGGDGGSGDGGSGDGGGDGSGGDGPGEPDVRPPSGPLAGAVPAGFAGRVNLTVPLATVAGLADRPGKIAGIGPVDPDPGANTLDRYQLVA
jgi:hypothetical protein